MTGREELEWARRRFDEFLRTDGPLLLKEDDPRVQQVGSNRFFCYEMRVISD